MGKRVRLEANYSRTLQRIAGRKMKWNSRRCHGFLAGIALFANAASWAGGPASPPVWTKEQRDGVLLDCQRLEVQSLLRASAKRNSRQIDESRLEQVLTEDAQQAYAHVPGAEIYVDAMCSCLADRLVETVTPERMRSKDPLPELATIQRGCSAQGKAAMERAHQIILRDREKQRAERAAAAGSPPTRGPANTSPSTNATGIPPASAGGKTEGGN